MPKGIYKHKSQQGFQKGHRSFLDENAKKKLSDSLKGHQGHWLGITGEQNPNWKGGKPKCLDCKKLLIDSYSKRCRKCFSKKNSGENNHNWIKDRSKLARYSNGNEYRNSSMSRDWAKQVKDRDNWVCRIADVKCDSRLEAHHILRWSKFPELRYEVNNGITLCRFHHPRKRNDEMRLSPFFQELVLVKAN